MIIQKARLGETDGGELYRSRKQTPKINLLRGAERFPSRLVRNESGAAQSCAEKRRFRPGLPQSDNGPRAGWHRHALALGLDVADVEIAAKQALPPPAASPRH
jgi:hypothetical protein